MSAASRPAFVREPEGNGVAERFIRTLKEQLLWVRTFGTVEELRLALLEFKERYNRQWLCERHGHQTPAQVRAQLLERAACASSTGAAMRARAVEALGSILREGAAISVSPKIPLTRRTSRLPSTRCPRNRGRYRETMSHEFMPP